MPLTNNANDSKYIRAVLKVLYGDNTLINRALKQSRCKFQAENRSSPRREFTRDEMNHIKCNILVFLLKIK